MLLKRTLFTTFLALISVLSMAQKGTIRGTIYEGDTGFPMYGVQILVKESGTGAVADLDGKFEISLAPGTYTLVASFVGFQKLEVSNVEVKVDEVTVLDNLQIVEATSELETVVVTAEAVRTTEAALLTVKKKSSNLIDGISAASFKKMGDGDAAAAAKRVPGVSIQGGKYVFVRGLGDRYSKSTLNGMDIPGLDPDRNTVQMDIFPTNVLDNIIILKNFTPDVAADFTGGLVDLQTKDFTDERSFNVSGSLGYAPNMHLNSDFLTYKTGGTDWLGYDDGTRAIPTGGSTDIPTIVDALIDPNKAAIYEGILRDFNPNMGAFAEKSFMDFSLGLSTADQLPLGAMKLGYNLSVSYKSETDFYSDAQFSTWGKDNDLSVNELNLREDQTGSLGTQNVLIGGLAGVALKGTKSKYRLNFMHLQNGESNAGVFDFKGRDQGSNFDALQHNLEYKQRALTNLFLAGNHILQEGVWEVDWRVSPTLSKQEDPDIRVTRIRNEGDPSIGTEVGLPQRIWRNLDEQNVASKLNIIKKFNFQSNESTLKFGGAYTFKERDFEVQSFSFTDNGSVNVTLNPDDLFKEENLWSRSDNLFGLSYSPLFIPRNSNKYNAQVNSYGAYAMAEMSFSPVLKAIIGARIEGYQQFYTGENQSGSIKFNNEQVLDDFDLFPSVNLVWTVQENRNIRASFSRTIARPSLKEASFSEIYDPLNGRTFIGGFFPDVDVETGEQIWDGNLQSTRINNVDLRYEMFQPGGQTISFSGFFKSFDKPIEMVQYIQAANNFQPRNVGDARVIGLEAEVRKHLGFISPSLEEFTFAGNLTWIDSQVDMSESEFRSRQINARDGETIKRQRDMAGQAPYIVNAGLSYEGYENNLTMGLFFNVQGETLQYVGIADRADVYTKPFQSLNLNVIKGLGTEGKTSISIKVDNILNAKRQSVFKSHEAQDRNFSYLDPGMQFTIGVSHKFFQ